MKSVNHIKNSKTISPANVLSVIRSAAADKTAAGKNIAMHIISPINSCAAKNFHMLPTKIRLGKGSSACVS